MNPQGPGDPPAALFLGIGAFYLVMGLLQGFTAYGIRRFKGWARIIAIIFSVIGLIVFPLGTLISGYFLYLLLSEKGKVVFSDWYQQVIAKTPHIKYRTSKIAWVALGLLVLLILVVVGGVVNSAMVKV